MQTQTKPEIQDPPAEGEYRVLENGKVGLPDGWRLEMLKRLTAKERISLPAQPKYFAKPGCRHCHGRGHEGYAMVMVKQGPKMVKTSQQIQCGCLMVLVKNLTPAAGAKS